MTASPIVVKGGGNQADYSRSINSLENLLDSKVRTVEDREELDSIVASPKMRIYFYGPVAKSILGSYLCYYGQLEEIKNQCMLVAREKFDDPIVRLKAVKLLWRVHENMIFCLESLGLWGGVEASQILSSDDNFKLSECKAESSSNDSFLPYTYLKQAASLLNSDFIKDVTEAGASVPDVLEEPFFSKKLLLLIQILSTARLQENMKCIVFVKRIIIAQSLTFILHNLKSLGFWRCHSLVGFNSGLKNMSRKRMNGIVEKFRSGKVNLLVATNVAEEGLDIQTCCLVIRFDLPETVTSFIQSRGRARMQQSEYAFLVERENQHELKLVNEFISNEERMNKEITSRTSRETLDGLQERRYKVDKTGANISTGSSVALLHHFCSKLPHDEYFTPKPLFVYSDDLNGTVCRIALPPSAPFREVYSSPYPSKDEAKRDACLKACQELHAAGCLSDYLLPEQDDVVLVEEADEADESKDDDTREELHERLIPTALSVPWISSGNLICLNLYFIKLEPIPVDRVYRSFGLFVKSALPKEAESMCLDLHLSHGRIVKTEFIPLGTIEFDKNEITDAENFQEMWLKIILDREELFSDFISLGKNSSVHCSWSTFYLLLPLTKNAEGKIGVDWVTVKGCLSSPVFRLSADDDTTHNRVSHEIQTLKFLNGVVNMSDVSDSIVVTPHNRLVFCVVDILSEINGYSLLKKSNSTTYIDHFKKLNIDLLHPEQPLLKAKQLFNLRNLLHNRLQSNTEAQEQVEHFVELPPEVCSLKVLHFSKEIGSSLSLLPSVMHRLENLLVAIELKDLLSASFSEGSTVTTNRILEALTTEKCLERFSLERLEVLGDAFLKYAVGRHLFLSYKSQDEGQLTKKRSNMVNNSHLRELAIKNNLQVYIRDQRFDPCLFHALGRSCTMICSKDTEKIIDASRGNKVVNSVNHCNVRCAKNHHWLHRKTIADVVEALIGAYIVDSGFKAAESFLRWIGIRVDFKVSDVSKIYIASESNTCVTDLIDVDRLEKLLEYKFLHRGLLLQAFLHPSHNQHSGDCYQRLEFLGDAVLDYLITSYLYSVYPDLNPGQLTDLRSMAVNNNSFAHLAVSLSFPSFLISNSCSLSKAINKFSDFVQLSDEEKDTVEEPSCPKVLGDLVESCIGAILLDAGFDLKCVWKILLAFLQHIEKFSHKKLSPIRELRELCQSKNFGLSFPSSKNDRNIFSVKAIVELNGSKITGHAVNISKKAAERMASQDVLSKLKAQGYSYEVKSLEEIVQSSRREEAVLIGYDETPIKVDATDLIQLRQLEAASSSSGDDLITTSKAVGNGLTNESKTFERDKGQSFETSSLRLYRDCLQTAVAPQHGSAKSHLYEMCSANLWNPPYFECFKDEGAPHMKSFTYKVVIKVGQMDPTVLEGFGEPRLNKKAAMEHAAEGALWYLRHLGY
ncbi:endoribonuclease Dicer homolog 4-like isoform X2 [Aristolochia californica]